MPLSNLHGAYRNRFPQSSSNQRPSVGTPTNRSSRRHSGGSTSNSLPFLPGSEADPERASKPEVGQLVVRGDGCTLRWQLTVRGFTELSEGGLIPRDSGECPEMPVMVFPHRVAATRAEEVASLRQGCQLGNGNASRLRGSPIVLIDWFHQKERDHR